LSPSEQASFEAASPFLLRKYIAYAKKYVKPKMTPEAARVLQAFYLHLRKSFQWSGGNGESAPITTRQLESMIRLSEARAKIELRESVTAQDAADVVDIMKESMYDMLSDQFGRVDFTRTSGLSKSKQVTMFMKALHRIAKQKQSSIFTIQELAQIASKMKLGIDNFDGFIEVINQQNYLLQKSGRRYQLQSSDYSL